MTTSSDLLPSELRADTLQVLHGGRRLAEPSLVILRIVNVGDRGIPTEDFESDITIQLKGVQEIASAECTARRPADLDPIIEIADAETAHLKPTLINPGDMIQVQMLSAGKPTDVAVSGRVADLSIAKLERLPYPPGMGPEGELVSGFEYFMWWVLPPALILFVGAGLALDSHNGLTARIVAGAAALVVLVLYLLRVKFLIERRARWRPY